MVDVMDSSARIAGSGRDVDPVTRMTPKVPQVAERVAPAESFGRPIALRADTSGTAVIQALQRRPADPAGPITRVLGRAGPLARIERTLRFAAGASGVAAAMVLAR